MHCQLQTSQEVAGALAAEDFCWHPIWATWIKMGHLLWHLIALAAGWPQFDVIWLRFERLSSSGSQLGQCLHGNVLQCYLRCSVHCLQFQQKGLAPARAKAGRMVPG